MTIHGTTLAFGNRGDTTIVWDSSNDAKMEEIIAKKMSEGITFFIIKPRLGGIAAPDKTALKKVGGARQLRALAVSDEDFSRMVGAGAAELVPTPAAPITRRRVSKNAREVAASESVGVRQMAGG